MIASVIATLDAGARQIGPVLKEIARLPNVEVGRVINGIRVPITIDAQMPKAIEETTDAIQRCVGVAFVDVVFVHFEDELAEHLTVAQTENQSQ